MDCINFLSRLEGLKGQMNRAIEEQDNLIADLNIESLVRKNRESIKRYAIKQLSQILYECVECQTIRQDIDWCIAEEFLNKNFTDKMWAKLAQQDIVLRTYDNLVKKYNSEKIITYPEIGFALIEHRDGYFKEFNQILKILNRMKEYSENEMDKKLLNASNSDEKRNYYLRRLIWDWGYQQIQSYLPRPPYGKIIFH
ncbi:hypothetical protein ACFLZ0_01970 [Patescibacteria group bacterium]